MLGFTVTLPVAAHQLRLFATTEGTIIRGTVYFAGGKKVANVPVTAFNAEGLPLGETITDQQGEFTFTAQQRVNHHFIADTSDGHQAGFIVSAQVLPASLGALDSTTARSDPETTIITTDRIQHDPAELQAVVEKAIARQIGPLRQQLEAYEAKTRWHDVLGGIGYILGLTGIACYLLARRQSPPD
ncbi:MAG: carboxypeptidase-like regulatory domain-containing protein [Candidatus Competibacteraceae bacterium]|nr:carboxypeptidase-like regulatory domain-containing protein [Candidatus Competibacteraceae bacterium]